MINSRMKKIIVFIFLTIVLFNFVFVLIEYNHDCTHTNDCPICLLIQKANDNLNSLATATIFLMFIFFCILIKNYIIKNVVVKTLTLINLKVRMNN